MDTKVSGTGVPFNNANHLDDAMERCRYRANVSVVGIDKSIAILSRESYENGHRRWLHSQIAVGREVRVSPIGPPSRA